jgi:hypoxanthine phosphoribosyltransferase
MKFDVFLSYSHLDRDIAEELERKLSTNGLTCFLAEKSIQTGTEWIKKVQEAIKESENVLILITPRSIDSRWVYMEVGAAWIENKTIFPLTQFVDFSELPEVMRNLQVKCIETEKQKLDFIHEMIAKGTKNNQIVISLDFLSDQVRIAKSKMDQDRFQPNLFIGCGRGGAICAGIFASNFGFHPMKMIDVQFIGNGTNRLIKTDDSCLKKEDLIGRNILLVEWTRQTGKTFEVIKEKILKLEPATLQSYAIFWTGEGKGTVPPEYYGFSCEVVPHNPWSIY